MDSLKEIFNNVDAAIIMNIHLNDQQIQDKLIWKDSVNREFTVKSGYIKARRLLGKEINLEANKKRMWSIIWKASISPKIKFFAWRLICGFLPVCSLLIGKGILVDNRCSICGHNEETLQHVFF